MKNNVIQINQFRSFEMYEYSDQIQLKKLRIERNRAWAMHITELAVTVSIGLCSLFCVYLVFTML